MSAQVLRFVCGIAVLTLGACGGSESPSTVDGAGQTQTTGGGSSQPNGTAGVDAGNAAGGRAGSAGSSAGGAAAGGASAACVPALARCGDGPDECCPGSVCLEDDAGGRRCRQTCAERSDCGTYCCVDDPELGMGLCAEESLCPSVCVEEGGECRSPGPECCESLLCVASTSAEFAGCRPPCETDDDCVEGCCIPFADASSGFCITGGPCTCAGEDATCGGVTHCCEGLTCTTHDGTGNFACKPRCANGGDCATGCCIPIAGTGESACLSPEWCD